MRLATTTAKPFLPAAISETYPQSKRTALLPARSRSDRTLAHLIHVPVPSPATPVALLSLTPATTRRILSTLVLATRPCPSRRLPAQPVMSVSLLQQGRSAPHLIVSVRRMLTDVARLLHRHVRWCPTACISVPMARFRCLSRIVERALVLRMLSREPLWTLVRWRMISVLTSVLVKRPALR